MNYKDYNDYEILYKVREKDEEALYAIFDKYDAVIKKYANKYYGFAKDYGVDINDLIQEGRIAVNKAIMSFNSDSNSLFYSYLLLCLERHLISFCRNISSGKNSVLNSSVSVDNLYFISDCNSSTDDMLNNLVDSNLFIDCKNKLDFCDSNIFELRFNGFSYKEISVLLDLKISYIDTRLCKIRKTLQGIKDKYY